MILNEIYVRSMRSICLVSLFEVYVHPAIIKSAIMLSPSVAV